jgi:hypothetical protein
MKYPISYYIVATIICIMALPPVLFAQVPVNDECSGATVITSLPDSIAQNTTLATPNVTDPPLTCAQDTAFGSDGKTVWFVFTPDSTGTVTFTTINSTPADYDIAMGLFTGTCGSLSMIDCNDDIDPGVIRQSQLIENVTAGTTYYVLIGEWDNGGPSGGTPTGGNLVFQVFWGPPPNEPPLYVGPRSGSVSGGVAVNTGNFTIPPSAGNEGGRENEKEEEELETPFHPIKLTKGVKPGKGPAGSNYIELSRKNTLQSVTATASQPVALQNFAGIGSSESSCDCEPPDPISAVGPNNVIDAVNLAFRIFDKNGNILKTISYASWFASTGISFSGSDPQVVYDQLSGRWVMTLLNTGGNNSPLAVFLSVSATSNPIGTWYNWALPAGLGDSATGHLADQPFVGYDDKALYITNREFGLNGTNTDLLYQRVRIIPKAQLYANTAGAVTWADIWGFRDPQDLYVTPDDIRPMLTFTPAGNVAFLGAVSPFTPGSYFTVWTIHDPIGTPTITGFDIPVVQYTAPPQPYQPGGSAVANAYYDFGALVQKPVYRDSCLWISHSVANPLNGTYSAINYLRINPFTGTNLEDFTFGQNGYWHYYPNLMTNANNDMVVTFSRSSSSEDPGAFFTGRMGTDPPGTFAPTALLKAGVTPYTGIIGPGSGSRWGDYMGIGLDPADSSMFWIHTEFVAGGGDGDWATWNGQIHFAPVPGVYAFASPASISYPLIEGGKTYDSAYAVINYGTDSLVVSGIIAPDSNFQLTGLPTFPATIGTFDSLKFNIVFTPKVRGNLSSSFVVQSNDPINPSLAVSVNGTAFVVSPPSPGTLYATTGGETNGGQLFTLDTASGTGTLIGLSGYSQIVSARQNPNTGELLGLTGSDRLVRIDAALGDGHLLSTIAGLIALKGMAFKNDTLYVGQAGGKIYRVDPIAATATEVCNTSLPLAGLDFNPLTGELWGCVQSGTPSDGIYKITLATGATTLVGRTGFNTATQDIIFDGTGNLYGVTGTGNAVNHLIHINTATGTGTLIGSIGTNSINGLAIAPDSLIGSYSFAVAETTGHSGTDSIAINNPYGSPLMVSSITTNNLSTFTVGPSSGAIPAGSDLNFGVTFNAATFGPKAGGVLVSFAPPLRRGIVTLSGLAVTPGITSVEVSDLWNLVSVPMVVRNLAVDSVFPGAVSPPFSYKFTGYQQTDTLAYGLGYWLKFPGAQTINIAGLNGALSDSISVGASWNLIGSLDQPSVASAVTGAGTHILTNFFGYDGGYSVADTLEPGKGYWVKTNAAGSLVLHTLSSQSPMTAQKIVKPSLASNFTALTIEDAAHNRQVLYLGDKLPAGTTADHYEKPPLPPEGIFDARFESNLNLEVAAKGKQREIPILLSSPVYPVTISWNSKSTAVYGSLMANNKETNLIGSGSIKLQQASPLILKLSGSKMVPTVFALGQNYPNPFNPTTTIHYDLPLDSKVTITIYDVLGQKVATLVDGAQDAGYKSVVWDSRNDAGLTVPSGVYFYRMQAGSFSSVKKLLLLR